MGSKLSVQGAVLSVQGLMTDRRVRGIAFRVQAFIV